jgi:2,4-dienoyl-CoA reductase-like NADH-dependent reductase (Old Yellow Enzyme family)
MPRYKVVVRCEIEVDFPSDPRTMSVDDIKTTVDDVFEDVAERFTVLGADGVPIVEVR